MITLDDFEEQWLQDIQVGAPSTTQLGNRFAQKILRDWHEIDEATAEIILCDGAGDGGIDAAVFVKPDAAEGIEGATWILVQSKYGTALSGPNTITLEAQKLFATLEGRRGSLSSLSTELVERLKTFLSNKGEHDKLEYILATSRKLTVDELDYLNNVRVLGRDKFGDCFDTDSVSVETIYNKVCEEQKVAGRAASPSARHRLQAGRCRGATARRRSVRRAPFPENPFRLRRRAIPAPVPRSFSLPSKPVHSRRSWTSTHGAGLISILSLMP